MTGGIAYLFAACALAQPPAARPPTLADLDRLAVDVLRDVHNRGAELYNRGDPAGCYRMYEGALVTVRPFLAHRPAVLKVLDAGLGEVSQSPDGVKVQAFRLHEVIEQVRADLKTELQKAGTKPVETTAKAPPQAQPAAKEAQVKGVVALDGKPLDAGEVTFVTLDLPRPRVLTAKVQAGAYAFPGPLPVGKYVVIVTGKGVPEKYQTTLTSGIRLDVAAGANSFNLNLMSK